MRLFRAWLLQAADEIVSIGTWYPWIGSGNSPVWVLKPDSADLYVEILKRKLYLKVEGSAIYFGRQAVLHNFYDTSRSGWLEETIKLHGLVIKHSRNVSLCSGAKTPQ